jgi:hypothetical protein
MKVATVLTVLQKVLYAESNKNYQGYSCKNSRTYNCRVAGCINKAYAKKLCNAHYLRERQGRSFLLPLRCLKLRGYSYLCLCGQPRGRTGGWYLCRDCYKRRRRKILKQAVVKLLGGRCSKCHRAYPYYVFDFHHVRGKSAGVGLLFDGGSLLSLATEIVKCILLCSNCHREVTYGGF